MHIDTDLNITGKVAQFGRGVMADVSSKLLGQFASNLERDVLSGNGAAAAPSGRSAATHPPEPPAPRRSIDRPSAAQPVVAPAEAPRRRIDSPEPQPVDLFDTAGNAVAKRVVPIVIVVLVALLTLRSLRKRRKRKKQQHDS